MDFSALSWLPFDGLVNALSTLDSSLVMAAFFLGTAVLVALCVPGIILPVAISSGALVGTWPAVVAVGLGAVAGSQILFIVARHFARGRMRTRLDSRLKAFERGFAAHGFWYVLGLRLIGAPHFLVTASSALTPIRPSAFAAATLLGLLPVIALAAATGSAI